MATKVKRRSLAQGVIERRRARAREHRNNASFSGTAAVILGVGGALNLAVGQLVMGGLAILASSRAASRARKYGEIATRSENQARRFEHQLNRSRVLVSAPSQADGQAYLNSGAKKKAKSLPSRNPARPSMPSRNPNRSGAPRGFANKKVQAAAQRARRRK